MTGQQHRIDKSSIEFANSPVAIDPRNEPAMEQAAQTKERPWQAVFPNPNPDTSQLRKYGFKKGERIVVAGNAGDFFAHGKWQIECESSAPDGKERNVEKP